MPKARIRPNPQLKQIVLEETNEGRDVVRYLKSIIVDIEGAPQLYGLRAKDYARSHKIAAARILARIGLEEGKRYLRRTYVRTPFRRIHPEEEDGPKRDMAASTAELYRLVKKETNDGRDIIIRFVGIMKGYHPEYKPHLRMAAAKELIRQIEFDYEDEPTETTGTSTVSTDQTRPESVSNPAIPASDDAPTNQSNPENLVHPVNPDSDKKPNPENPINPDSGNPQITAHQPNHINHSSDDNPTLNPEFVIENPEVSLAQIRRQMHVEDGSVHYRDYADQYAGEAESIYQSIIRRAAYRPDLQDAKRQAEELIGQFDQFMEERDPGYQPISVPDQLITKSLADQMDESEPCIFDPGDYFDLDQDYFYYCLCGYCEHCDEVDYFFEFMRELEEEYEDP